MPSLLMEWRGLLLNRTQHLTKALKAAFVIIFVFLALRYDYGNDHMPYLAGFKDINSFSRVNVTEMYWEPGWIPPESRL